VDSGDRIWIATYEGGIFVLDHAGSPFDKLDDAWTQFTTSDGMVDDRLYALVLDEAAGHAWVGTREDGIGRLDYAGTIENKSDDTWTIFTTEDPLPHNRVRALLPEGDDVWIGTRGGGLAATDVETWTTFATSDGVVNNDVEALASQDGLKWVGTGSGLSAFDDNHTPRNKSDDTWTTFGSQDGLSDDDVQDLTVDSQGGVWIATDGGGLSVLDYGGTPHEKSDDTWIAFTTADGLAHDGVESVAMDEDGRVWASTYGGGVSVLDFAGTRFEKSDDTWMTYTTADNLDSNYVLSVALDGNERLWIGTNNALNLLEHAGTPFDKSDDIWTLFRTTDGLAGYNIRAITFDAAGRLLLTTTNGLSILDTAGTPHEKSDDAWHTWRVADGLVDSHLRSVAIDPSGAVWVGTENGLSRLLDAVQYQVYLPIILKD
jgi:ligand-binding sensor domain-containing protein